MDPGGSKDGDAHWRSLANTTEPYVCCQRCWLSSCVVLNRVLIPLLIYRSSASRCAFVPCLMTHRLSRRRRRNRPATSSPWCRPSLPVDTRARPPVPDPSVKPPQTTSPAAWHGRPTNAGLRLRYIDRSLRLAAQCDRTYNTYFLTVV